ncbi:hypothetical protein D9758_000157 [Tetrapyrgos nigripes]|uniref:COX assembly mitochondrial protein n=1 Tax=Tetrapyrgos nigripes TaxID=182062 RepID=A0A8H5H2C1_9AGAR|nr:hypothetical protein D9758_000157 [Tetrapyrgos nigripes]
MNALSRREEEELLKATKAQAMKECDTVVKAFADCMSARFISVAWACRGQLRELEACMVQYTGPEPMEIVRSEYLKLRNQRKEEKLQSFEDTK